MTPQDLLDGSGTRREQLADPGVLPTSRGFGRRGSVRGGQVSNCRSAVWFSCSLGTTAQIACPRCAGIARLRAFDLRPRRVLLIDDDTDYRDLLRRLLEDRPVAEVVGYVGDGREALVEIARLQPATIVLDLAMRRLGGLELIPRLSEELEVIVLSGKPEMRARCQELYPNITVLAKDDTALSRLVARFAPDLRQHPPPAHEQRAG
jgi:CheY-like chemotaxis protein